MKRNGLLSAFLWLGHALCAQLALDPTFGTGGLMTTSLGVGCETACNVVVQPDGKIIVLGNFDPEPGVYDSDLMLVRYGSDGAIDSTFGTDGMTLVDVNGDEYAFDAVLQADGSIVVAGASFNVPGNDKLVMRFTPDGMPDPTFGDGGVVIIDDAFGFEHLRAVALQADDRIVVAGGGFDGERTTVYLARLHTDGTLDSTFAEDGKLELLFDTLACFAMDVAVQGDGKIVCGGTAYMPDTYYDPGVVRCLPDGTLDDTFGEDGKVTIPWCRGADDLRTVALQADGKILVAGADSSSSQAATITVSRLLEDGTLDTTFGEEGTRPMRTGIGGDTRANAVTVDTEGRILLAGTYRSSSTDFKSYVCRLDGDGDPDPTFGDMGELIHATPGMREMVWDMALQADGAIVLAGLAGEYSTGNVLLMRYADAGVEVADTSPSSDILRVDAQGLVLRPATSGPADYQVTDHLGRLVMRGAMRVARMEDRRIDFPAALPTGIYLLDLVIAGRRSAMSFAVAGR